MKQTLLTQAIAGRPVVALVNGLYAPHNKTSNLHRAIMAHGYSPADIGRKIDIAVGAHRRRGPDGWKMAIVEI